MPVYALKTSAAWISDDTLNGATFADVASPGDITGLTNGTAYQARQVLLSGLSAEFTPALPPAQSVTLVASGDLGSGTSFTLTGAIPDAGFYVLCLANDDASAANATVQFNGVAADLAVASTRSTGGNTEWHYLEAATAGNIAITAVTGSRNKSYSLWKLIGYTATGRVVASRNDTSGPTTLTSVPDGAAILAASTGAGATDIIVTAAGTTEAIEVASDAHHTVNTGVKSGAGSLEVSTTNNGARNSIAAVAFPEA